VSKDSMVLVSRSPLGPWICSSDSFIPKSKRNLPENPGDDLSRWRSVWNNPARTGPLASSGGTREITMKRRDHEVIRHAQRTRPGGRLWTNELHLPPDFHRQYFHTLPTCSGECRKP